MTNKPGLRTINASEHLTSLGWAGPGHSLDSHTSNRGLSRPLLVTHKANNRGLGSRSAKERQADQWWLNAFDSALRDINNGTTQTENASSALERVQQYGMGKGSLYGWFKRGEVLGSTFEEPQNIATKKRKSGPGAVEETRKKAKHTTGNLVVQLPKHMNNSQESRMLKLVAITTRSILSLLNVNEGNSKANRALLKAELRSRRRSGEFDPPEPLTPKENKRYTKTIKRQVASHIKGQLLGGVDDIATIEEDSSLSSEVTAARSVEAKESDVTITKRKKRRAVKESRQAMQV